MDEQWVKEIWWCDQKKQEGIKSATEMPESKNSAAVEDQRQGEVLVQKTEWRKIQRQRKKT
jgi:hypothetical protein